MEAKDGWVSPGLERGVRQDTWPRVCGVIGRPDLKDNPAFGAPEARREHGQDLSAILSSWTVTQPKEEIYHLLQELRSVAGYVATVETSSPHGNWWHESFFRRSIMPLLARRSTPALLFASRGTPGGTVAPPYWASITGTSTAAASASAPRSLHACVGRGQSDRSPACIDVSTHDQNDRENRCRSQPWRGSVSWT